MFCVVFCRSEGRPAKAESLTIDYTISKEDVLFQILRTDGKIAMQDILPMNTNTFNINTTQLLPGVYELIIKTGETMILQKRIIIL